MKAYKVVFNNNNFLESCCRNSEILPPGYKVRYIPGEFAKPILDGSLLYAFSELVDAKTFVYKEFSFPYQYNMEIWECELRGVSTKGFISNRHSMFKNWNLFNRQKRLHKKINIKSIKTVPGTIWAKEIKLLRKVEQ